MKRIAITYPGQGSQVPGMGKDAAQARPDLSRSYYDAADEILGLPLSRICFEGDAEQLRDTAVTQPAIFLTSLVFTRLLEEQGVVPDVVAGHSLGEYAALVAAGVLDWPDALRLVRRRGELMAAVNRRTPGRMAAVLDLGADRVDELCAEVTGQAHGTVQVANYNSATQTVVSGDARGIDEFAAAARRAGARHVVDLKVGAPFHSVFMKEIEAEFAEDLAGVRFAEPSLPVVANATAGYVHTAESARELLRRQLASPVLWTQTVELLVAAEVSALLEVGPGRVLSNIARASAPGVPALSVGTIRQLDKAVAQMSAVAV
ncbi:ACP S-malonyltransferase [Streptomyces misionensis]|uniref:Malonyl CoA-acyl carrier protein transacylase n=2 Tax=Streptomyces misionensis TaxID=67331 RepID=A0A5C6JVY8_9ACTN|nr:ACP S-malonyltransferase [Streptomyces misionensis]